MSEKQNEKLTPNPEHLAKLKEGVDVWNTWCEDQKKIDMSFTAQLQGANLNKINLQGAQLYDANFQNAQFHDVNLQNAQLNSANLQGASLYGANLQNAYLYGANFQNAHLFEVRLQGAHLGEARFEGAHFSDAQLEGVRLNNANLSGAFLSKANLQGAKLSNAALENTHLHKANLQDANLSHAKLKGADLSNTHLQGANLQDADLTNTNLAYASTINFSDNKIDGAVITSTTTAPWLTLKKSYTNTMMLFTLAAVFTFFLPYVVNVATWRSVNLAQQLNSELEASLAMVATELETEGYPQAFLIRKLSDRAENITPCYAEDCKPWRIWQLLLGVRRGWLFAILSIPIISYNFARVYLTREISILKDSEQATGLTPRWESIFWKVNILNRQIPIWHQAGYQHHYRVHRIIWWLQWVALFAFIVHSIFWLGDIVQLPIKP